MSKQGDRAYALFCSGANCAQSTFGAFAQEIGLAPEFAARLASGFGGGLGRQREICGALAGICMVAGVLYGYADPAAVEEKTETYEMIHTLCARFRAANGSILCRELLGIDGPECCAAATVRDAAYYADRPCAALCRSAADILASYEKEKNESDIV